MLKYLTIFISFFFVINLFSQNYNYYKNNNDTIAYNKYKTNHKLFIEPKFDYRINLGTSFTNFDSHQIFNTFIAPEVSYRINPKLNISGGILYSSNIFSTNVKNIETQGLDNSFQMSSYYFFAKGNYKLTENINLRMSSIIEIEGLSSNINSSSYNFGMDFKLSENTFIHADVEIHNYNNPRSFNIYNPIYNNNFNRHRDMYFMNNPFFY